MRYLYTILLYLATPFLVLRLYWRSRKNPGYRHRWLERFGFIPVISKKKCIWIHAVSLGESIAAKPLIQNLIDEYPSYRIVVTTTTPTGSQQIQKTFGNAVYHVYAPYDLPVVIKRFLRRLCPAKVIIMETELWPNLLHQLHCANIPVMIANARLSERSLVRYQRVKHFFKPLLQSIQIIAAQSEDDAKRFQSLGIHRQRIIVTGNIKFDHVISSHLLDEAKKLRQLWSGRPTLIAASTHEGEEAQILQAFHEILLAFPSALLIIAPRHPERFSTVQKLCEQSGYTVAVRSKKEPPNKNTSIYLADSTGELMLLYGASDVAFVGGSLVPIGGHNLIEPASLGLPVMSGPNLQNFSMVRDLLFHHDALILITDANELAHQVIHLFTNVDASHHYGARALSVSEQNRGAIAKHLSWIRENLSPTPT